jgi:hypothetical protein
MNTLLTLLVGQQRPITHGTAIYDGSHAGIDQLTAFRDQSIEIGQTIGTTGRHQGGNAPAEYIGVVSHSGLNAFFIETKRSLNTTEPCLTGLISPTTLSNQSRSTSSL